MNPSTRGQDDARYSEGKRLLIKALEADPALSSELESLMSETRTPGPGAGPEPAEGVPGSQPAKPGRPALKTVVLSLAGLLVLAVVLPYWFPKPKGLVPPAASVAAPAQPGPSVHPSPGVEAQPAPAKQSSPPPAAEPSKPAPAKQAAPEPVEAETPAKPKTPPIRNGGVVIEWVTIPGGSFMMGDEEWGDSKPVHSVSIRPFQLSRSEVTVKQYKACVDAGACTAPNTGGSCNWGVSGREEHPVNCVDWNQAGAFAKWAGGRLPSEAEWEYAARSAGRDQKYPWGDSAPSCQFAVMNDGGMGCGRNSTWPVCSKAQGNTEQGVCDMAGNVWEWMQDLYHGSYDGAPNDGSAWESPSGSGRVDRGGSWFDGVAGFFRAGYRNLDVPGRRLGRLGVRVAR